MRHKDKRYQLNRFTSWHEATIKSLSGNIIIHQGIKTTLTRAKAVRPLVERLISLSKENSLNARRNAFEILGDHKLVARLFNEVGPLFAKRNSGFTRIISLADRRGDNAKVVVFELTERKPKEIKKPKKAREAAPAAKEQEHIQEQESPKAQKKARESAIETEEKQQAAKKPSKKFLGGIRNIFKKERDSL